MKVQVETAYPAETLYRLTVMKPAKRLLGIAANRYTKQKDNEIIIPKCRFHYD